MSTLIPRSVLQWADLWSIDESPIQDEPLQHARTNGSDKVLDQLMREQTLNERYPAHRRRRINKRVPADAIN